MLSIAAASSTAFASQPLAPRAAINMGVADYVKSMPGEGPFGFFDPLGFMSQDDMTEGKARYYREVELKHGRVAMLAAVGFVVAENFHPLFGGFIDVPSYVAFQETPLQTFWTSVVGVIGCFEFFSVAQIENGFEVKGEMPSGEPRIAGDFMFDPLNLKVCAGPARDHVHTLFDPTILPNTARVSTCVCEQPKDAKGLAEMQTKELNNGRLAMIAIAGMVGQELATGSKLF